MRTKDFNKVVKQDYPKHILFLYTTSRIYLTDSQLQKIIDLKNKGE